MGTLLSEPVTAMVVEQAADRWWEASSASMQGWRKKHEDAHILQTSVGAPGGQEAGIFAVLDGHGGQAAAILSKELLQERLTQYALKGTLDEAVARDELEKLFLASDAMLRERLPAGDPSGTTVVAAVVTQHRPMEYCVVLAHAGDCRAVLWTAENGLVCSEDHKPQRKDEIARIQAAGGTVERGPLGGPWRVDGSLAVSRAFGDFTFKPARVPPRQAKVSALPDVQTVYCRAGDWLLLACDGIFDVMSNEETADFFTQRINAAEAATPPSVPVGSSRGAVPGAAWCVQLLQHVLAKGTKDNCTALLVQFLKSEGPPLPYRKELLKGNMAEAPPDIRMKYLEFIEASGFSAADAGMAPSSLRSSLRGRDGSAPAPVISKSHTDSGSQEMLRGGGDERRAGGSESRRSSSGKETSSDSTAGTSSNSAERSSNSFLGRRSFSQPVGRRASVPAGSVPASGGDGDVSAPRVGTISKALQAMKSTRTIQRAWRRSQTSGPETTDGL